MIWTLHGCGCGWITSGLSEKNPNRKTLGATEPKRGRDTEPRLKLQNRSKSARSDGEIQEGFQEDQCNGARRSAKKEEC